MNEKLLKTHKLLKAATYMSVTTAGIILLMKIYAWALTDSVSVLASLADSSLDITSSLINMLALRYALIPADNNHRFGHEKIQDLAVFGQGIFFILSSFAILYSAIVHAKNGATVSNGEIGTIIMVISIILTLILVSFQTYVLKKTNSNLVKADKLHYISDLFANIAVIVSLYLSETYWFMDSLFASLIALYLFHGAYEILMLSLRNLLDEEFNDEEKAKLIKILSKYKKLGQIVSVHDLKTRKAGNKHFIQFHQEMKEGISLLDAHEISENIEADIVKAFPDSEVIIHQDPEGVEEDIMFKEKI